MKRFSRDELLEVAEARIAEREDIGAEEVFGLQLLLSVTHFYLDTLYPGSRKENQEWLLAWLNEIEKRKKVRV